MPKAYSGDMRERVIGRVASGASRREAEEHFEVSASTAIVWVMFAPPTSMSSAPRLIRSTVQPGDDNTTASQA